MSRHNRYLTICPRKLFAHSESPGKFIKAKTFAPPLAASGFKAPQARSRKVLALSLAEWEATGSGRVLLCKLNTGGPSAYRLPTPVMASHPVPAARQSGPSRRKLLAVRVRHATQPHPALPAARGLAGAKLLKSDRSRRLPDHQGQEERARIAGMVWRPERPLRGQRRPRPDANSRPCSTERHGRDCPREGNAPAQVAAATRWP